jgi:hypothetical protein
MAKAQKRGSREIRKPKQPKKIVAPPQTATFAKATPGKK